jgi:hypothetical protein
MKCTKCDEAAVAHDDEEFLCREHLRIRCPEYTVTCPHCDLSITIN